MSIDRKILAETVCIDVGGQHISAVAPGYDEKTGLVVIDLARAVKRDLPDNEGPDGVAKALQELVKTVAAPEALANKRVHVSVATPGPIDKPALTVRHTPNARVLWGFNVGAAIQAGIPFAKVYLTNDGNAHASGVLHSGEAAGVKEAWAFALGTGVGAGFFTDGHLVEGHKGNAAEAGHWPVRFGRRVPQLPPLRCGCGAWGCVESYLGAQNVVNYARALLDENADLRNFGGSPSLLRNGSLDIQTIFAAAKKDDKLAFYLYELMMVALADLIETACKVSNPQAIFLCGGIAKAGDFLLHGLLPKLVEPGIMSPEFFPEVKLVEAPEHTALLGLAYVPQG